MKPSRAEQTASPAADDLVDAFERATRMLVGLALRSLTAQEGTTVPVAQFRLLVVLFDSGPLPSSQAAAALGIAASSVTRLADRLETAGLLARERAPDNRSVVTLRLTADGDSLVRRVLAWRKTTLARMLEQLDQAEVAGAARTLHKLTELAATDEELGNLLPYRH